MMNPIRPAHRLAGVFALAVLASWLGNHVTSGGDATAPAAAPDVPPPAVALLDGDALYDRARAAAVEVLVAGRQEGSGWFASPEGLVITAAHVVWKKQAPVEVVSPVAGRLAAEIVALDRGHDLALLRVAPAAQPYPALAVADRAPPPGEEVLFFGSAFFRHEVMLRGSVARKEPTFEYFPSEGCHVRVYHVTAPSPPGTSGGCWMDRQGRVVGNQSGFMSINNVGVGIAMTAPPDAIIKLLATRQSAELPGTGCAFEELTSQQAGFVARYPQGAAGLVPVFVRDGGAAQRAGLGEQTLIVAADGKPVRLRDELMQIILTKRPGEKLKLHLLLADGGGEKDVEVTLEKVE